VGNKIAFVIGNGTSRKPLNLNYLIDNGTIVGCNALYRDFMRWDVLVAIDDGMIDEVLPLMKSLEDERIQKVVVPPPDERWEDPEYNPHSRRRSNAGMNAMIEAIRSGHNILYCLGFDFILEGEVSTDNIYKNTQNYGPETHAREEDNYHRIKYLEWFCNKYSDTKFVFVIPDGAKTKPLDAENIVGMTMSTFKNKLGVT
jgi:hypothetical protein